MVVFDSAVEGFFMTHYDFLARPEDTTRLPPGPSGLGPLNDMLVRLSRAPVVSIASIRGRATGVGSELALACDMRFASREKAVLSHFEVGAGVVPGGGPMARLPRLMGRGRALEVLLGADDIPGDLAERYGYVNRSFPDSELDAFVESLANRIASFDKQAISETKRFADVASLPPDFEIAPEWEVSLASIMRPAAQEQDQDVDGTWAPPAGRRGRPVGVPRGSARALRVAARAGQAGKREAIRLRAVRERVTSSIFFNGSPCDCTASAE